MKLTGIPYVREIWAAKLYINYSRIINVSSVAELLVDEIEVLEINLFRDAMIQLWTFSM